jgi:hypothetical protein
MNAIKFNNKIPFNFDTLNQFCFGGVYIIEAVDNNGTREIVKIGESNFIYRRLANYLQPFQSEVDKNSSKRVTKIKNTN